MNSILGALVGDAAGATLEFYPDTITDEMATRAMTMPGGGPHHVGPGQFTDDGELTLALWSAIKDCDPSCGLPIHSVINAYVAWYKSCPFDIGRTCSLAIGSMYSIIEKEKIVIGPMYETIGQCKIVKLSDIHIRLLKQDIYRCNKDSEANGALMRATAIATWIAQNTAIEPHVGAEIAMDDAALTHPHLICQETNSIYVFAIINLLRGISPEDTIKYTDEFVNMNEFSEKVREWYFKESLDISTLDATKQCGHVRWGFVLAFYFLRHPELSYEDAIKITLMKGGDTDTNAAIVGGMVGTYSTIPDYMSRPVLSFDCTVKAGRHPIRPSDYSIKQVTGTL